MNNDGFLEDAWAKHHAMKTDVVECNDDNLSSTQDDVDILNVSNLGGIFAFHYILILIALLTSMIYTYYKKRKKGDQNVKHIDEELSMQTRDQPNTIEDMFETIKEQTATLEGRLSDVEGHVRSLDKKLSIVDDNLALIIGLLKDKK